MKIESWLLFSFLLLSPYCLFSQSPQFQHITSDDGISQSEIYTFLEDSQGFMWFGTVDGLNRYDGYDVHVFHTDKDSPNSISNNTIRCLAEDEFGRIWIGTDDGLCVYDARLETIHQIHLSNFNESRLTVNSLLIDKGHLYLGTSFGLLVMDVSANTLDQIDEGVSRIKAESNQSKLQIVASKLGKDGIVWITTSSSLYLLDPKEQKLNLALDLEETLPDIRNLEEDGFGNLWIVCHDFGFARYDPTNKDIKYFKRSLSSPSILSDKISSVTVDRIGNLWIGTHDKGLLFLEKEFLNDNNPNFQSLEHDPYSDRSLSSNLVYSLYVSKSNLLWIGTIGSGINIYDPDRKPFNYFNLHNPSDDESYNTNFIRAVYGDRDDNIWIGTHNNGLFFFDRKNAKKIDKKGLGTESVFHINDAGDGKTFVCTGEGINLIQHADGKMRILSSLKLGPSFYVTKIEGGYFWVATLDGVKKCSLSNGQMILEKSYNTASDPALSFNNCRVIYFNKEDNNLFIGTEGGGLNVMHLNDDMVPLRTNIYQMNDSGNSISNNYVRSIDKGSDSDFWIGTYEGLNRMVINANGEASFSTVTTKEGLPSNTIQSIAKDENGDLWIGTNNGLCKFDPLNESFTQYSLNDGIQSNEFSEHTIFRTANNEIIIGGINGINTFYPEQILTKDMQPNTTLTDFYLFNKSTAIGTESVDGEVSPLLQSISLTDSIFLEPNQNSIGFDFSAMIYNAPEKVQYAYMLEGFDKEWVVVDADNRRANYTNLGFGEYSFQVKAGNNEGLWEETPKTVFVKIKTPWYMTIWAFLLYGLIGLGAIIFFTNYSILKYTTKEKLVLENLHNKKVRELEEQRTQFFINISHDLRTPLTLISSPLDIVLKGGGIQPAAKKLLNLMQRNVTKLKDMTEQLLDISKVEAGNLAPKLQNLDIVSFVKSEASLFENAFDDKGIDLVIESDQECMELGFDTDMISKVMFNMLSNALKHTPDGKVRILICEISGQSIVNDNIDKSNNFIKISIEDSGNGIEEADLRKVFDRFYQGKEQNKKGYGIGLSHCKDLIAAHKGYVDVESEKGVGSTFNIYLPNIKTKDVFEEGNLPVTLNESIEPVLAGTIGEEVQDDPVIASTEMKILLVEDNPDLREFIARELGKTYQIIEAEDGEIGLEMAKEHFPNLIVSDVMMPNMDGMEFCKEVKSNIKTSHIPVILLTAKVDKETKYQGLEIGADDYISKPFEMEHLLLRIRNLIKNRERMRKLFRVDTNLEPSKVTVTSIDEEFLSTLMAAIEKGIPESNFAISNLEQEMGMSHSSFYNKIKSITGHSAKELVFNMRMKRAKQILEDTSNIRVSEVAYLVGFSDPKYFSKCFKEYHGGTPSKFVKKS